mmetsp:Transcript_97205/g.253300  ORF Transcript_97205/g.253300 Transcript_97205/m.253300 type:complete len:89 (+) Transcript_97205:17-283(+)
MSQLTFAPGTKEDDRKAEPALAAPKAGGAGRGQDEPTEVNCLYCRKQPVEYETDGCQHAAACKKCAMKTATGGKCKVCGELFPSWRRV